MPAETHDLPWTSLNGAGQGRVAGEQSWAAFPLAAPRHVAAVEIEAELIRAQGGPAAFRISWKPAGQDEWQTTELKIDVPEGFTQIQTIFICDRIEAIRIFPDRQPGEFRLRRLRLLLPAARTPQE